MQLDRFRTVIVGGLITLSAGAAGMNTRADLTDRQTPGASPQAFRTGVDLVVSDVTVIARGETVVDDLTADDFLVTVDGTPRRIAALKFVRAHGDSATGAAPPASSPGSANAADPRTSSDRTVFLVVDRERIVAGGGRPILEAAVRFVDTLGPRDRVGLWTLPFVIPVTDREHLKRELVKAVGTAPPPPGGRSIAWDEHPSTPPPSTFRAEDLTLAESLVNLNHLVTTLAPLDGTKHVVLITGGTAVPQSDMSAVRQLCQRAAAARVRIHALQVWNVLDGLRVDGNSAPPPPGINQSSTAEARLAYATGGITVTSLSGTAGFSRLTLELSAWYVVGIEPDPADRDGKAHALKVTVPGRDGLVIRAREEFLLPRAGK